MRTLKETLGYYRPAFFKIYIASQEDINVSNLQGEKLATFVHEYTHFIQDFTTLKGLQNIFNTIEQLRLYVTETYKNRKIEIPVSFNQAVLDLNQKIADISWGSDPCDELDNLVEVKIIREDAVELDAGTLSSFPQLRGFKRVIAGVGLPNGGSREIEIGTLAVMESMAYLAERLMGLPATPVPDYPYKVVRLMADALCPKMNLCDEILFALCDVSLQCTAPGMCIYEMLRSIGSSEYGVPADGYDVYRTFQRAFDEWSNTTPDSIVNMATEHLLHQINGSMGEQYKAWVQNLMSNAVNLRKTKPHFLIDCVRRHDYYKPIMMAVGTPMMVNDVEMYTKKPVQFNCSFPLNMDVEFFVAIEYIMDLFETGKKKCSLYEWCCRSGLPVDGDCKNNPPTHSDARRYQQLCPVGAIWRHWDLSRYRLNRLYLYRPICGTK